MEMDVLSVDHEIERARTILRSLVTTKRRDHLFLKISPQKISSDLGFWQKYLGAGYTDIHSQQPWSWTALLVITPAFGVQ